MQQASLHSGHHPQLVPPPVPGRRQLADTLARERSAGAVIWVSSPRSAKRRDGVSRAPDLERALINPAAAFRSPDEVVHHPMLSLGRKREILRRWAWDEYLIEVAQGEGMPDGPPSRLDEVKLALLGLGDEWRPHPAAPAAFLPRYDVDRCLLAA